MLPAVTRNSWRLALVLASLVALLPSEARAQTCTLPASGDRTYALLHGLDMLKCLGGPDDPTPIAVAVHGLIQGGPVIAADAPADSRYTNAVDVLLTHTKGAHTARDRGLFDELADNLMAARAGLGSSLTLALPDTWRITNGLTPVVTTSLKDQVDLACVTQGDDCEAVFNSVQEAMRIIGLARHILDAEGAGIAAEHRDEARLRKRKWGAYFDNARSQYPWELKLNSVFMVSRPMDADVSQGFYDVPSVQLMLLHPTIAFEFDRGAPNGQRLESVVLVDLIGINKWAWRSDGSMSSALGVSLVASIGDKVSGRYLGWGAMIHINHAYSAGFTLRRGGERAFIVSADVSKLWTKASQDVRQRIARIRNE